MYGGALSEVSNRASWLDVIELRDSETDEELDLTGTQEIVMQVVALTYDNFYHFDYGLGFGGSVGAQMITATLTSGTIVIIAPGMFQFAFTRAQMSSLPAGDYNVGICLTKDDQTVQLFAGQVPIREGFVTIQAGSM